MKYEYKGNIYNYVGVGKFKDSTGKWIDAMFNREFMNDVYRIFRIISRGL